MNFNSFLLEAKRAEPLKPDADTPERRKIRAPGDVGPVERLTQMDKDKPGKRDYSRRGQYIRRVDQERDTADKLISSMVDEEPDMDPKYDPDAPGYKSKSRSGKEIQQSMTRNFRPGMDAVTSADRVMRDKVKDAQRPTDAPIKVKGIGTVPASGYLRHGYQSSGVGLNKKLGTDDLDYIYAAISDETPVRKEPSITGTIDKRGIENTKQFTATRRDLEQLEADAEAQAVKDGKAYLTPEVVEFQRKFRQAAQKSDAKAIQDLVFRHEVTPEVVDQFIEYYGSQPRGGSTLFKRIEAYGNTAPDTSKFGGDLGPEAEKARVPGTPEGVYNYKKLTKQQVAQAKLNRTRAIIETYLKQGARDAYANHEGIRSITDMDLEHIASLKGDREGNFDHPSNWVMASQELNRMKSERDLTSTTEKLAKGPGVFDYSEQGKTFIDFTKGDKEEQQRLIKLFGGDPSGKGKGKGVFGKTNYEKLSDEEREELRQKARDEGFVESDIMKVFPESKPDPEGFLNRSAYIEDPSPDKARFTDRPLAADPDRYEADHIVDARDKLKKRFVLDVLMDKYPKRPGESKYDDRLKNTEEYKEFQRVLKNTPGGDVLQRLNSLKAQEDNDDIFDEEL